MWYNLDGEEAAEEFKDRYEIINVGLNGTACSAVQMQILSQFMEPGDVLFHTPELSSSSQLMLTTSMTDNDASLWSGIENNYDLFSFVDLRTVSGVFDSLTHYLSLKKHCTEYTKFFSDDYNTSYMDRFGCIPFYRSETAPELTDGVGLNPAFFKDGLETLSGYYQTLLRKGVAIYVSYACTNMDAVLEEQRGNVDVIDKLFRECIEECGAVPVSTLTDYLFVRKDFYDTNYHLRSEPAWENTLRWLADLKAALP